VVLMGAMDAEAPSDQWQTAQPKLEAILSSISLQ
jgi:hypothetical protein